jgi:UDP-glucose 4-epimerase
MVEDPCVVGQVINIGPDEEFVTIKEVAETCANLTGFNGDFEYVPDRPQEVKHATCSSDKARKLLGYKTMTNTKEGIKKTYEYIKHHGPRAFQYHIDIEIINDKTPKTWTKQLI